MININKTSNFSESDSTLNSEIRKKYLTTSEVAKILGITPRAVLYMAQTGKITSYPRKQGKNRIINYFLSNEVTRQEEDKKITSEVGQEDKKGSSFLSSEQVLKDLYLEELEVLRNKNEKYILEIGRLQGLNQGKEEQIRQFNNLLSERAESLIEKEAKLKELESKLEIQSKELEKYKLPWWKKIFYKH